MEELMTQWLGGLVSPHCARPLLVAFSTPVQTALVPLNVHTYNTRMKMKINKLVSLRIRCNSSYEENLLIVTVRRIKELYMFKR